MQLQQELPQAEERWDKIEDLLSADDIDMLQGAVVDTLRPVQHAVRAEFMQSRDNNSPQI